MAQVKFANKIKYKGAWYLAHEPFEVDDKDVQALVDKGAMVTIPAEADGAAEAEKSINSMKVDELKAYAEAHNIDIGGAERKADILAAIKAAERSE